MKYALVNGEKAEAQPGLRGVCPHCQSETIAKCGNERIKHWAHKGDRDCDPWWENETEWHRAWKNLFPREWQENNHIDSVTGEKHIADIRTDKGFVVEFQHSTIKPDEIKSREGFYKNMVWVVDGTRLKNDYPRFCKGFRDLLPFKAPGIFLSLFPSECFPTSWLNNSVPVYFDFQGLNPVDRKEGLRDPLWCLFPGRAEGYAVLAGVPREDFVKFSSKDPNLLFAREMLSNISKLIQLQRTEAERRKYPQYTSNPIRRGCKRL